MGVNHPKYLIQTKILTLELMEKLVELVGIYRKLRWDLKKTGQMGIKKGADEFIDQRQREKKRRWEA